jgi:hypothetical protein
LYGRDAKPRLLEQMRYKLRAKHCSDRTEQQYVARIRRFILHHGNGIRRKCPVPKWSSPHHLAIDRRVAASRQNQALAALLFLYRQVLETDLPWLANVIRARRPSRGTWNCSITCSRR